MKNGAKSVKPIHWAIPSQGRLRRQGVETISSVRVALYSNKGRSTPHPQIEDDDIVHS